MCDGLITAAGLSFCVTSTTTLGVKVTYLQHLVTDLQL